MKFTKQELSEALYANCRGGAVTACKILIEMGADPHALSITDGESPLHAAAFGGRADMCRLLLEYGVDADIRDSNGFNALLNGSVVDSEKVMLLLIAYGADTATPCDPDKNSKDNNLKVVICGKQTSINTISMHSAAIRIGDAKRLAELLEDPSQPQDSEFLKGLAAEAKRRKQPEMTALIQAKSVKNKMNAIRNQAQKSP